MSQLMVTSKMAQPELELKAVKEELDLAKKKIDRYAHLGKNWWLEMSNYSPSTVIKLYDELDNLRESVCNNCRKKLAPYDTAVSSSSTSSSSLTPLWRGVFQGRSAQPRTDSGSPSAITDLHDTEAHSASSSTNKITGQTYAPAPVSHPNTAPVEGIANAPIPKPDLSVVYNHEVKQTLNVHLDRTLTMKSTVYCLKFSRGGKYLAMGLRTGEIYIYDIETFSGRLVSSVCLEARSTSMSGSWQTTPRKKNFRLF